MCDAWDIDSTAYNTVEVLPVSSVDVSEADGAARVVAHYEFGGSTAQVAFEVRPGWSPRSG